jgi:replication factor C subunit 1
LEPLKKEETDSDVEPVSKPSKAKNGTNGKSKTFVKHETMDNNLEDMDNDDDVFAADFKKGSRNDDYEESDPDDVVLAPTRTGVRGRGKQTKAAAKKQESSDDEDDNFVVTDSDEKPVKAKKGARSKKRKSEELEDDEDEAPPKRRGRQAKSASVTPAKSKAPKKAARKEPVEDSAEMKDILANIPTIRPPTPPPRDSKQKWNPNQYKGHSAVPAGAGSKEIPEGAENCLAGLSFVFTGVLDALGRDEGTALVKRYGGKVVGAPSSKTSYVVLGSDAGPSKLQKIKDHGLKTINEDGLFELIRRLPANGGGGAGAAAAQAKADKEAQKAREEAEEMEELALAEKKEVEKKRAALVKVSSSSQAAIPRPKISEDNKLWTVKYAPSSMGQIVGNKTQVEKLSRWLKNFRKSARLKFKIAGPDGSGAYRAVIIHGPPGIGKTTAAHLVAKLEGYDIVETNASDSRSKKMVDDGLRGVLGTTSILGYYSADGSVVDQSKRKIVLIMDEVDGMSAGDRGGVGALAAIVKKTTIPIILICNERRLPKMKPFDHVTYDLPFRRPTTDQIRSRMMTIAFREKLKLQPTVLNALIEGTGADIRQVVNMLSTAKLDEGSMDYEQGKQMSKAWEKHVVMKPWDITGKILGGGMFAASSKHTLNDKIELYFNDHDLSHLFIQENYLGTQPIRAAAFSGAERKLKILELASQAADSISDGDLVDRMIHGTQQQWSLMPLHGMMSFVRPASYVSGSLAYGSTGFPQWLGQNSKAGKLSRMVREIQGHMRLRTSAGRHEVRQHYVPMFWDKMPKRLQTEGKAAAQDIIDLMDSYYLTRDDFDAIQELGVGKMDEATLKIESQAKATFTRL